jgi:ABC-type oligopeptide transport system substrate-binding subunit
LLSLPGVAELRGDYVRTAQMRLDVAQNEAEGRRRLRELHQLVHHEATVIPLWQMVNHLAYRRSIVGIGQRPLHLYQDVPNWRRAAEPAVALK